MGERTPKNNEESSKSKREGNLGFRVRFLTGDRWDFLDEQQTQALSDRAEEIFVDLTWEEQDQLWRLVQREELRRARRNIEKAREHLHDIVIGGINERRRHELELELLKRRSSSAFLGSSSAFLGSSSAFLGEAFTIRVYQAEAHETQIRRLEEEKAKQRALEEELLLAKQRREGSRSHPPDETILPPLIDG
jgi:hypothetical protein